MTNETEGEIPNRCKVGHDVRLGTCLFCGSKFGEPCKEPAPATKTPFWFGGFPIEASADEVILPVAGKRYWLSKQQARSLAQMLLSAAGPAS